MATVDPLTSHGTPPGLPNVRDLTDALDEMRGDRAALIGYVDRMTLALARTHGTSVETERLRYGIPQRFCGPIPPARHPRATPTGNGAQEGTGA